MSTTASRPPAARAAGAAFRPVHRWVLRIAAARPDATAFAGPGGHLSYGALAARVRSAAGVLERHLDREPDPGLPADARPRVAILADDPAEVVTAILATLGRGGVFVPLDPAVPDHRLAGLLARTLTHARTREIPVLLVAGEGLAERARAVAAAAAEDGAPEVPVAPLPAPAAGTGSDDRSDPPGCSGPDDPCYVYFTSGSTGRPKGIVGRLGAIDHFVLWEIETLGLGAGARVSQLTSPAFDAFLRDAFVPLCAGGTVCAPPRRTVAFDGPALAAWLERERVEVLHAVPSVFRGLLGAPLDRGSLPALRHVLLAGEVLHPRDVGRWHEATGGRAGLVNLYGPSETTMTKLFHRIGPAAAGRRTVPVGRPMPGAAAVVVDSRDRPCPAGTVGEIVLRTPYRCLGYLDDPEATRRAFVPNPFGDDPDDLVYRTGDLGRLGPDDAFELVGRRDHQVKVRGVRVELAEVEAELLGHPSVAEAAVAAREADDGGVELVAAVTPESAPAAEVHAWLAERLPAAMVPPVVALAELPRTVSGKVDRRALADLAVPSTQAGAEAGGGPPRTPFEEAVAEAFVALLPLRDGETPRAVSRETGFFAAGGHSLLAARLANRLRRLLGVDLAVEAIFAAPTVAGIARALERAAGGDDAGGEPIPRLPRPPRGTALLPATLRQELLRLRDETGRPGTGGDPGRRRVAAVTISGRFDPARFGDSLSALRRRHEALRTSLDPLRGACRTGIQVVRDAGSAGPLPVRRIDFRRPAESGSAARVRTELVRAAERVVEEPFDLSSGPLWRCLLARTAEREHVLVLVAHEAVADGGSLAVLVADLVRIYRDGADTAEPPLQPADVAAWERRRLAGGSLEREVAWWSRHLAEPPARLVLGAGPGPEAAAPVGRRASIARELPASRVAALEAVAGERGATLFALLLAALAAVLHRRLGDSTPERIEIGVPVARRDRDELTGVVGPLGGHLPVAVDLSGDPRFAELMERTRDALFAAYARRAVPSEAVLPERGADRGPDFQVTCNLVRPAAAGSPAAEEPAADGEGISVEPLALNRDATPLAGPLDALLNLHLVASGRGLRARLDRRTDSVGPEVAEEELERWTSLLTAVSGGADPRLSELAGTTSTTRDSRKEEAEPIFRSTA